LLFFTLQSSMKTLLNKTLSNIHDCILMTVVGIGDLMVWPIWPIRIYRQ